MKRFCLKKPQVRFQSRYPLVQIEELRSHTLKPGQTATLPLRDYYEWTTMPDIMKQERFFTKKDLLTGSTIEDLQFYDPIMTQSIAKWLLVNYKLNAYPYYDLNIVNVFTDLRQAVRIAKGMMTYFQSSLSREMFERIKYFIIPLYNDHTVTIEKLLDGIPGDVRLIENAAIFPPNGTNIDIEKPFSIQDPVYILLLNDIIKNLSHDLVQFSDDQNEWQQCYIDVHADSTHSRRFDKDMDFWCQYTLQLILDQNQHVENQFHIPTRLVQLFDMIKICAPEHRLFAVDVPQRWQPSFWTMAKVLLGRNSIPTSKLFGPSIDKELMYFITNFSQVQKIYSDINESSKHCEFEDFSEFVDQWTDLSDVEKHSVMTRDRLDAQLETIRCSNLGIIYST